MKGEGKGESKIGHLEGELLPETDPLFSRGGEPLSFRKKATQGAGLERRDQRGETV